MDRRSIRLERLRLEAERRAFKAETDDFNDAIALFIEKRRVYYEEKKQLDTEKEILADQMRRLSVKEEPRDYDQMSTCDRIELE